MLTTDKMFRAFADETRLRILHLLSKGEVCVCHLMSALSVPQSKVSRHLAYLKAAGLVSDRKTGRRRHYSLSPANSLFHRRLIACIGGCLDETPSLKQDLKRLAAARRGSCA